jgi:N-methylhydantoinase A
LPVILNAHRFLMNPSLRIGIDIGGTFTDFVIYHPETGQVETFKLPSTPSNPAEAVLAGVNRILAKVNDNPSEPPDLFLIHGSTVATNALLEHKGAPITLVTTRGFRDIIEIARQTRPALYDLYADPPPALVPRDLRLEVDERVDCTGMVLTPLAEEEIEALVDKLSVLDVSSVAMCLLFSFLQPEHERMIARRLTEAGYQVSVSSDILPEYREYERLSTTVINAYVSPILDRYLGKLEAELTPSQSLSLGAEPADQPGRTTLRVMQSNGGHIRIEEARRTGVHCILSGPAGGVVGASYVARVASRSAFWGWDSSKVRVITFDMGGTSTDVSLVDGEARVTTESQVGGYPIRIPVIDIHTIGAGGGSIASVDAGGALRVGPQSAGADPGPACYGRSPVDALQPTVTDANLVLGRLVPEYFMDGTIELFPSYSEQVIARLGEALGLTPCEASMGVIEVVNAHMERALRVISVERGYDPRGGGDTPFALLSFGGAGGLHAANLARRLGIPRLLIPPIASTLSAFGMLAANVIKDYTQTVMLPGDSPVEWLEKRFTPLLQRGQSELTQEGLSHEVIHLQRLIDMRYVGQSYELTFPWDGIAVDILQAFHECHRHAYGYARPEAPAEIVNLRVRATGWVERPPLVPSGAAGTDPAPAYLGTRPVVLDGARIPTQVPLYRFEKLRPGYRFTGPALIVRSDTTILAGPADAIVVDEYLNLVIEISQEP